MSEERFWNTDEYASTAKFAVPEGAMTMRQAGRIFRLDPVYCKIELPKVANGNWRMLHLQIGESCKAFARSAQERCSA